jgi:6,7-dimethyl-8-ribityllumazine synthase
MDLSLAGVPIGFGVLTVENEKQAKVRADRKQKNKGAEVVAAVLRMVGLSYRFRDSENDEPEGSLN